MPLHETPAGAVETLEWGEGPEQIILLHAAASSPHALTGFAECLARPERRIIAPMLNGYGRTQMRAAGGPIEDHLTVAAACLGLYPADRRIVFGHSMGGLVALLSALRHHPLDALILFEPIVIGVLDFDDTEDREACAWDRTIVRNFGSFVAAGEPERGIAAFVEAWNEFPWDAIPDAVRARLVGAAPRLAAETHAVGEQEVELGALAEFFAPVLLLQGTTSPALPSRVNRRLAELLRNAECTTLNELGHMGPVMVPTVVADAFEVFLSQRRTTIK